MTATDDTVLAPASVDGARLLRTAVLEHRPADAVAVVEDLLDAGTHPLDVLDEVARVQREVGDRWQRGAWTVTEEHRATGIAALAVEAVDRHVRATPPTRGRVVVACAEREWHGLAQALITTALRSDGWQVTALGPSSSLQRFGRALHDLDPDATALSCSLLRSLPSARSFIQASAEAGVPLLAGGAAFGVDASRALGMGAAMWAADGRSAVVQLGGVLTSPQPAAAVPEAALHEWATLDRTQRTRADALRAAWAAAGAAPEAALAGAIVDEVVGGVLAALVTGDARVLAQARAWCADILAARGAASDLGSLLALLATDLRDFPVAHAVVRECWG